MYNFYHPQSNPRNLTGQVGGAISSTLFSGYLNELFYHIAAPPSGLDPTYQYRKLFVKNEFLASSTDTRVWIDAIDHVDQISISFITGSNNATIATPSTEPAGVVEWVSPTTYADGLEIGTLNINASTGIWLRETLSNIVEEDPFASFRLYVGGIVAD